MAQTIRIDAASHAALAEIAKTKHIPLAEALRHAVELYQREVFLDAMTAGYAAMRGDADAWTEEQAERGVWDATLTDGLDEDDAPSR
jgi:hypothetical protein